MALVFDSALREAEEIFYKSPKLFKPKEAYLASMAACKAVESYTPHKCLELILESAAYGITPAGINKNSEPQILDNETWEGCLKEMASEVISEMMYRNSVIVREEKKRMKLANEKAGEEIYNLD